MQIALTREFLLKFLKFGAVGLSGVFVNFGITYVCKEWLKWNKYLSNILGFVFAATTNYILNRLWTFQSEMEFLPQQGFRHRFRHAVELFWQPLVYLCVNYRNFSKNTKGISDSTPSNTMMGPVSPWHSTLKGRFDTCSASTITCRQAPQGATGSSMCFDTE